MAAELTSIPKPRPPVLTVAGLDPTGSAGILSDIRVLSSIGCHPCGVVTCETVQSSRGMISVHPADPAVMSQQLALLFKDVSLKAVKVGAMASVETISALAVELKKIRKVPVVIDPVFRPTKGPDFLNINCQRELSAKLLPLATIVTPNVQELGIPAQLEVDPEDDDFIGMMADAWFDLGFSNLLVTGLMRDKKMVDRLFMKNSRNVVELIDFTHPKHAVGKVHGTGCVLSTAIAGYLALGKKLDDAVDKAIDFTSDVVMKARQIGKGTLFWAE